MELEFKPDAVEFVRKHGCANSTPVELIVEAMEFGAAEAMRQAAESVKNAKIELEAKRAKNL